MKVQVIVGVWRYLTVLLVLVVKRKTELLFTGGGWLLGSVGICLFFFLYHERDEMYSRIQQRTCLFSMMSCGG